MHLAESKLNNFCVQQLTAAVRFAGVPAWPAAHFLFAPASL